MKSLVEDGRVTSLLAVQRFRDNDAGYLAWRGSHLVAGFVANVDETGHFETKLHRADCWTLSLPIEKGLNLTGPYSKVCSTDLRELQNQLGPLTNCPHCQ